MTTGDKQTGKIILQKIKFYNFRNFAKFEVDLSNLVMVSGASGSGKTTLLEAINYLKTYRNLSPHDKSFYSGLNENPSIEYFLNPIFFGYTEDLKSIIIRIKTNKIQLTTLDNLKQKSSYEIILQNILNDIKINYFSERFLDRSDLKTQILSKGQSIKTKFLEMTDNLKESIILVDDLFAFYDISTKGILFERLKELSKDNQVIFTVSYSVEQDIQKYISNNVALTRTPELRAIDELIEQEKKQKPEIEPKDLIFVLERNLNHSSICQSSRSSIQDAISLFRKSRFVAATRLIYPSIEEFANSLLRLIQEDPDNNTEFQGLNDKLKKLAEKKIISYELSDKYYDIGFSRNKILHANIIPQDQELTIPIFMAAVIYLNRLIPAYIKLQESS